MNLFLLVQSTYILIYYNFMLSEVIMNFHFCILKKYNSITWFWYSLCINDAHDVCQISLEYSNTTQQLMGSLAITITIHCKVNTNPYTITLSCVKQLELYVYDKNKCLNMFHKKAHIIP